MDVIFESQKYGALVRALAQISPCPFAGRVTEDQVKLVLGEFGDIWPMTILADAVKHSSAGKGLLVARG